MWKAVIVLFVTSGASPMSMVKGEFPNVFKTETACQAFVKLKQIEVDGTLKVTTETKSGNYQILNHTLTCIEDDSGTPT